MYNKKNYNVLLMEQFKALGIVWKLFYEKNMSMMSEKTNWGVMRITYLLPWKTKFNIIILSFLLIYP